MEVKKTWTETVAMAMEKKITDKRERKNQENLTALMMQRGRNQRLCDNTGTVTVRNGAHLGRRVGFWMITKLLI